MSSNWGIKTDDGYVNFIHGTIDKVWDFETSSSIDDIVIFSERAAKGYAKAIKANAIQISISEQPQLTIPKSIAERLDKEGSYDSAFVYPRTWELEVQGTLESCRRINVQKIYLISKALGVDLVKVVEG